MKALTLTQPWASLVMLGQKQWETRSWRTHYTGLIAIHAAQGFPRWAQQLLLDDESAFSDVLNLAPDELPRGALLGVVRLWCCRQTDSVLREQSISKREKEFGDWSAGRWAWGLQYPQRLQHSLLAKGSLGLWTLSAEQERRLAQGRE